jgi:hypothetical protein
MLLSYSTDKLNGCSQDHYDYVIVEKELQRINKDRINEEVDFIAGLKTYDAYLADVVEEGVFGDKLKVCLANVHYQP